MLLHVATLYLLSVDLERGTEQAHLCQLLQDETSCHSWHWTDAVWSYSECLQPRVSGHAKQRLGSCSNMEIHFLAMVALLQKYCVHIICVYITSEDNFSGLGFQLEW